MNGKQSNKALGSKPQTKKPREKREARYQGQIIELAQKLGYQFIYHTYDSRRSTAGYPDLHLIRVSSRYAPRQIYAELKSANGRVTQAQRGWIAALSECGVEVYVWREGTDTLQAIADILQKR